MFSGCKSLIKLDLSNFNTDKVTNMKSMFEDCISLVDLDFPNINKEQLKNIESIFYGCSQELIQSIKNQKNILI